MTYPTKYTRQYDFLTYANANPTRPLPGQKVNVDYDAVASSISEIVEFLKLHSRSDGAIANAVIGRDQLTADILALIDAANGSSIPASQVTYSNTTSGLAATTVQTAIDEVVAASGAISSVFGRTGAISAAASDYDASQVDNDSGVAGAFVSDALDQLAADIAAVTISALDDVGDVTITAVAAGEILKWSGTAWINNTLAEAGIAAASHTHAVADLSDASANGKSLISAANYAAMRTLLDLEAGTDFYSISAADAAFQPLDATLTSLAALGTAADKMAYTTGVDTWAEAAITAAGRSMVAAASATAQTALLDAMTGDSGSGGVKGLVPAPAAGDAAAAKFLKADGTWTTPAGSGNVSKVGTPVDNQVGVWTGDGTIEGTSALTFDGSAFGVTGNITVTGTVDGRDVAADGTKLDGIESAADVTDAINVAAAGAAMLSTEDQTLAGGARVTVKDLGNLSGATITPDPGDRPIQKITNNGAGTIAPGANVGCYLLVVKNTTGAGAVTTSGWQDVSGEAFDTTTTSEFLCHCTVTGDLSAMVINKVA